MAVTSIRLNEKMMREKEVPEKFKKGPYANIAEKLILSPPAVVRGRTISASRMTFDKEFVRRVYDILRSMSIIEEGDLIAIIDKSSYIYNIYEKLIEIVTNQILQKNKKWTNDEKQILSEVIQELKIYYFSGEIYSQAKEIQLQLESIFKDNMAFYNSQKIPFLSLVLAMKIKFFSFEITDLFEMDEHEEINIPYFLHWITKDINCKIKSHKEESVFEKEVMEKFHLRIEGIKSASGTKPVQEKAVSYKEMVLEAYKNDLLFLIEQRSNISGKDLKFISEDRFFDTYIEPLKNEVLQVISNNHKNNSNIRRFQNYVMLAYVCSLYGLLGEFMISNFLTNLKNRYLRESYPSEEFDDTENNFNAKIVVEFLLKKLGFTNFVPITDSWHGRYIHRTIKLLSLQKSPCCQLPIISKDYMSIDVKTMEDDEFEKEIEKALSNELEKRQSKKSIIVSNECFIAYYKNVLNDFLSGFFEYLNKENNYINPQLYIDLKTVSAFVLMDDYISKGILDSLYDSVLSRSKNYPKIKSKDIKKYYKSLVEIVKDDLYSYLCCCQRPHIFSLQTFCSFFEKKEIYSLDIKVLDANISMWKNEYFRKCGLIFEKGKKENPELQAYFDFLSQLITKTKYRVKKNQVFSGVDQHHSNKILELAILIYAIKKILPSNDNLIPKISKKLKIVERNLEIWIFSFERIFSTEIHQLEVKIHRLWLKKKCKIDDESDPYEEMLDKFEAELKHKK